MATLRLVVSTQGISDARIPAFVCLQCRETCYYQATCTDGGWGSSWLPKPLRREARRLRNRPRQIEADLGRFRQNPWIRQWILQWTYHTRNQTCRKREVARTIYIEKEQDITWKYGFCLMTLHSQYLERHNQPKLDTIESDKRFKEHQTKRFEKSVATSNEPIPDMREQLQQIRKSKITHSQDVLSATSSTKV